MRNILKNLLAFSNWLGTGIGISAIIYIPIWMIAQVTYYTVKVDFHEKQIKDLKDQTWALERRIQKVEGEIDPIKFDESTSNWRRSLRDKVYGAEVDIKSLKADVQSLNKVK